MKFKQVLALSVVAGSSLSVIACNGGHQSLPETNYGGVVNVESQDLKGISPALGTTIPIFLSPLYAQMLNTGKYGESIGTGGQAVYAYEKANIANTLEDYNVAVETSDPSGLVAKAKAQYVSAYSVQYYAPGQNSQKDPAQIQRTASGIVIVPRGTAIRGVVLYFHPTVFGKNQVPSCIMVSSTQPSYCTQPSSDPTGFGTLANLASVYASRGFAVVAPDYIGMGADWNNVHPYVAYPENNVLSGFYMFPALRQILAKTNPSQSESNLPLMITGYSEGGGYALKASQMAQGDSASLLANNKLTLKITTPQEGAYALQDQMNFDFVDMNDALFNCSHAPVGSNYVCGESSPVSFENDGTVANVSHVAGQMNNWRIVNAPYAAGTKVNLNAYVLIASMYYSFNNLTSAYNFAMNPEFWQNIPIANTVVNLLDLFSGNAIKYTGAQIDGAVLANSMNIVNPNNGLQYDVRESYTLSVNDGGTSLMNITLPKSDAIGYGQNNAGSIYMNLGIKTSPQFNTLIDSASTFNWKSNSPINFVHMDYDSAVTVLNTYQAYSCMKYGKSFVGNETLASSSSACTTASSGSMIESTSIHNAPMTNEVSLWIVDGASAFDSSSTALTRYWTSADQYLGSVPYIAAMAGLPFDHGDMFVLGNIISMCTFENMLANGTNSGVCPTL